MNIEEFLQKNPELLLEAEQSINLDEELTIACNCHCGSRSTEQIK